MDYQNFQITLWFCVVLQDQEKFIKKTDLCNYLINTWPEKFKMNVSYTTRSPRPGEIDGVHYYFVRENQFEEVILY